MFQQITNENFLLFAIKHYDNPQCVGESEFYDDMKRFTYIKRLLTKYEETGVLKERLILNHIIIITNLFGVDAGTTLLLFKIEPKYWPQLKSFLSYLNMIDEHELRNIPEDLYITKILESI
jgi:hypothetical protein